MTTLLENLEKAWLERELMHMDPDTNAYRIFHGYSEGAPGLEIDRYGDTAIITSKGADEALFAPAAERVTKLGGFANVIVKVRGKEPVALIGKVPSVPYAVVESGLTYMAEANAATNPGLYLDARPARRWLRENSRGRRILNLFSFAGSLGVAAMAGGCSSVTHVDTQKRALARCKINHECNGQAIDQRDLVREDVVRFLAGASKRRFSGIIIDPPPGSLSIDQLMPALESILDPSGWILCFFHHDERSWDTLEQTAMARATRPLEVVWRGQSGTDFPETDERRTLRLSVLR